MSRKTQQRAYADGMMYLYTRRGTANPKTTEDLTPAGKLRFDYRSIRQEDYEFSEQLDRHLSLKVNVPLCDIPTADSLVRIGDVLYAVIRIDPDRRKKEMYMYLTEVRRLA